MSRNISLKEAIKIVNEQEGFKKETISFRCNPNVLKVLKDYCFLNNISLSGLINMIVYEWYENHISDEPNLDKDFNIKLERVTLSKKIIHIEKKIYEYKNEINSYDNKLNNLLKQIDNMKDEVRRDDLKEVLK